MFPSYCHEHFANRTTELSLVLDVVRQVQLNPERLHYNHRRIVLDGSGLGMTWLLKELEDSLRTQDNVKVYCFHPPQPGDWLLPEMRCIARAIQSWGGIVAGAVRTTRSLQWACEYLVRGMESLDEGVACVFLLDAYSSDAQTFLNDFQENLLLPLLNCRNAVLVMAKCAFYPDSRLRSTPHKLEGFNLDGTREQIQKQFPEQVSSVEIIHALTGGNPARNWWVAQAASQNASFESQQFLAGIKSQVTKNLSICSLELAIEALCVLRGFSDTTEELNPFLEQANLLNTGNPPRRAIDIFDKLIHATFESRPLLIWNSANNEYQFHSFLHWIFEQELKQRDPIHWRKLNKTAYELYSQWSRDYPDSRQKWEEKANYHAKNL
jgi:hypothetical protein